MIVGINSSVIFGSITAAVVITSSLVAILRFVHNQVVRSVEDRIRDTAKDAKTASRELTPNGGSSVKDAIDRIETETFRQGHELDALSLKVERHLGWHAGQQEAKETKS